MNLRTTELKGKVAIFEDKPFKIQSAMELPENKISLVGHWINADGTPEKTEHGVAVVEHVTGLKDQFQIKL